MSVGKEELQILQTLIAGDSARGMFSEEICERAGLVPHGAFIMPLHGLVNHGLVELRHRDYDAWPSQRPAEAIAHGPGVPAEPYLYRILPAGTALTAELAAAG